VVTIRAPTAGGPAGSIRTLTTSSCHSANRVGSVTYAKTSSGGLLISMSCTIGGMAPPPVTSGRCGPSLS
jgi:hypothetical protein